MLAVRLDDDQPAFRLRAGSRLFARGRAALDERAAADAAFEQAFGGEVGQGFAEGLGINAESAGKLSFARQFSGKLTARDRSAQAFAKSLEFVAESYIC